MPINAETISLIMGVSSFIAAIIFFFAAKASETHTIKLLAKISNQTNTLERINDNFLGYAIQQLAKSHEKIIDIFIPAKPLVSSNLANQNETLKDKITSNIMVYYYTARTNYFANYIIANMPITAENKAVHVAAKEAIIASLADFKVASNWFNLVSTEELKKHHLYKYAQEVEDIWEPIILKENKT